MITIETKYLGYCKECRILRQSLKQRLQQNQTTITFMKTNTIPAIITSVAIGILAGFGATRVSGDAVVGIATTLSFLAVAALFVIAAADYRSGTKPYFAGTVATSHFKRVAPTSVGLRTSSPKARLAA